MIYMSLEYLPCFPSSILEFSSLMQRQLADAKDYSESFKASDLSAGFRRLEGHP